MISILMITHNNLRIFVTGKPPTVSFTDSESTSLKLATLLSFSSFPVSISGCDGCLGNKKPSINVVKIEPGLSEGSVMFKTISFGLSVLAKS